MGEIRRLGPARFALALGAPGLFLVAFLDSSFLSLPEITDLLLVCDGDAQHPARMLCLRADDVARIGGRLPGAVLPRPQGRRGVRPASASPATRSSARCAALQRYGLLAVLVPSLLPPPAPFKIFVLLAGVAGISVGAVRHRDRDRPRHPLLRRRAAGGLVRRPRDGLHARATAPLGARSVAGRPLAGGPGFGGRILLWRRTQHAGANADRM